MDAFDAYERNFQSIEITNYRQFSFGFLAKFNMNNLKQFIFMVEIKRLSTFRIFFCNIADRWWRQLSTIYRKKQIVGNRGKNMEFSKNCKFFMANFLLHNFSFLHVYERTKFFFFPANAVQKQSFLSEYAAAKWIFYFFISKTIYSFLSACYETNILRRNHLTTLKAILLREVCCRFCFLFGTNAGDNNSLTKSK